MATTYFAVFTAATATPTWARADLANGRNGWQATGYVTSANDATPPTTTTANDEPGSTLSGLTAGTAYKIWAIWDDGTTSSNGPIASAEFTTVASVVIGQPSETDTAQPFTALRTLALSIGQPSETDSAQPVTAISTRVLAIGQPSEADSAQPVTASLTRTLAIGQVAETDTAQPVSSSGATIQAIGQASETDTAQPATALRTITVAIGQAQETNTAQAASPVVSGSTLIGQASETDTAQPVTVVPGALTVAIGQATEADTAQAMSARAAATILAGMALEIDAAQPLTALISGASLVIGQAGELDIAQALANIGGSSSWTPGDGAMSPPRIGMARNGELWTLVIDDDNVPTHAKRRGTAKLVKVHALPGGNQGQVMTATGVVLVVM